MAREENGTVACGHESALFGSPICAHLRACTKPWLSDLKYYTGVGMGLELLCQACADARASGAPVSADPVCEMCFLDVVEEIGDRVGSSQAQAALPSIPEGSSGPCWRRAMRAIETTLAALVLSGSAVAAAERIPTEPPADVVIGRHTFYDFGPPTDFYQVVSLRPVEGGTTIERLLVTPPGLPCVQPASAELATRTVADSVTALLGGRNPCAIPEKSLRRERKRCKDCLVFSGANVVMQVRCGDGVRRIRMDILDRDLFDAGAQTPEHTSWTMDVLGRVDDALGRPPDRPLFSIADGPSAPLPDALVDALGRGDYDALVGTEPGALAALYADSQKVVVPPTVELSSSSSFGPEPLPVLPYPDVARLARVEGDVSFTVDVSAEGAATDVTVLSGLPLFGHYVDTVARRWSFPSGAEGRTFAGTLAFRMNCKPPDR